jgi:hypothetical protein
MLDGMQMANRANACCSGMLMWNVSSVPVTVEKVQDWIASMGAFSARR